MNGTIMRDTYTRQDAGSRFTDMTVLICSYCEPGEMDCEPGGFRLRAASVSRMRRGVSLESNAVSKMRAGPSESAYRRRLQTTLSCIG